MKTRIYTLLSIAALPFVLFSCVKEKQSFVPAPENLVEVRATIADNSVKVVAADAENGLDWNWAAGDQIGIAAGDKLNIFDIRSGFGPKEASFVGKEITGEKYNITYPAISAADMAALKLDGQIQTGNGSKEHLQYFALLEDAEDYKEFAFSPEAEKFKQCGVLHFSLVLPAEATKVDRVILRSKDNPIFHVGNAEDALSDELSLGIMEGAVGADHTFEAWMTTSWYEDAIPAGTPLEVNVIAGDFNWVAPITVSVNKAIKPGFVNNAKVEDASLWANASRYADGEGTEENPWQIKTAKQLMCVYEDLVEEQITYYVLIADIDLTGYEWVPLNYAEPYKKYIHFDGQGHTINNLTITQPIGYASFAGVLYGTLQNVTFNNASINAGNNKSGVVAGYMGTSNAFIPSVAKNVTVKNSTITATTSCGGFVGQTGSDNSTFENCHVIGTTVNHTGTANYHVGGFVGRAQKAGTYTDCSAEATVSGTQFVGGFAGYIEKGTYTRCASTSTVAASGINAGGFVGKTDTGTLVDCYYAGPSVSTSHSGTFDLSGDPKLYGSQCGGFVGYANKNPGASFTGCYVQGATLDMADAQNVGGFAGQFDNGSSFTKCYVKDVTLNAGFNAGGFVGAALGQALNQCYVDGGTLNSTGAGKTDDGVGAAGFAAYTEGATIRNCFTTMAIPGEWDGIGGFFAYAKANTTIQYCYADTAIESAGDPVGIFGAWVEDLDEIHINSCIGWSDALPFIAWKDGGDVSANYCGVDGTISSQAAAMGWDPAIWNFAATLRSIRLNK